MTQELVVWALIAGLSGLVWVLTCAILTQDRPAEDSPRDAGEHTDTDQTESPSAPQRRVAA